jgi:hypothetical protein
MSLFPCSACGARRPGKLSNATWAWWNADNERSAWRQRLCVDCYVANVATIEQSTRDDPMNCPVCHTDAGEQMDPCYLTIYIPGVGPMRLEMATCAPCAVEIRNRALVGAEKLPDRRTESVGQGPGPQTDPATSVWQQLGIQPRE